MSPELFLIFSNSKLLQGQFLRIAYYRFSICTVRSKHIFLWFNALHCRLSFDPALKKFPIMCSHSPTLRMRLIIIVIFFFVQSSLPRQLFFYGVCFLLSASVGGSFHSSTSSAAQAEENDASGICIPVMYEVHSEYCHIDVDGSTYG